MGALSVRNTREILRDPVNLAFGLGFPIALLLLMAAIQANIPVSLFSMERLAPGVALFGLSFVTLFSATLLSKDRSSAFLARLFTSPLRARDFLLGYTLPLLPMCLIQSGATYCAALVLGLAPSVNILAALAALLPADMFFISLGLLCGSVCNDRQVGGLCGALLTNAAALLSGAWFDLDLVGGWFGKAADLLPFRPAVDAGRAALAGDWAAMGPHLLWVSIWAAVTLCAALYAFRQRMRSA